MRLELHAVERLDVSIQRGNRLRCGLDVRLVGIGARTDGIHPLPQGAVRVGADGLFGADGRGVARNLAG